MTKSEKECFNRGKAYGFEVAAMHLRNAELLPLEGAKQLENKLKDLAKHFFVEWPDPKSANPRD